MKQILISLILFCTINTISAQSKNTILFSNENVDYKVAQDQDNLYVNISTTDNKTIMSIVHLGLTVYFDIKGKKKKNVYVKYPIEPLRPKRKEGEEPNEGFQTLEEANMMKLNIAKIIENDLPQEGEYRYLDYKEQFHILLNSLGISMSYNYDITNGLLDYNLKIPKNRINSDTKKDLSKLMVGVKTNSNKQKQKRNEGSNVNMGGSGSGGGQGGPPGGGQGGGQGGPPGGGQGEQRNEPPTSDNNSKPTEVLIDFWFKANL